jgi:hypothetical protein
MKKFFALGGVLYVGIGAFLTLAIYLRGSDSAYTSDQPWFEALEVGLVWPWHSSPDAGPARLGVPSGHSVGFANGRVAVLSAETIIRRNDISRCRRLAEVNLSKELTTVRVGRFFAPPRIEGAVDDAATGAIRLIHPILWKM